MTDQPLPLRQRLRDLSSVDVERVLRRIASDDASVEPNDDIETIDDALVQLQAAADLCVAVREYLASYDAGEDNVVAKTHEITLALAALGHGKVRCGAQAFGTEGVVTVLPHEVLEVRADRGKSLLVTKRPMR